MPGMVKTGKSYFTTQLEKGSTELTDFELIDQLWFEGAELTVKDAREIVRLSQQQPLGNNRLIVISQADELTEAVQNTFLKLLEEPPPFLAVILQGENFDSLLATIRSRLHRLESKSINKDDKKIQTEWEDYLKARSSLEKIKDRNQLKELLIELMAHYRGQVFDSPEVSSKKIQLLDAAVRRLGQNANQKLIVDSLLLNWPFE